MCTIQFTKIMFQNVERWQTISLFEIYIKSDLLSANPSRMGVRSKEP